MRIGVLGLGFMGSTHLQAWSKVPRADIAAVVSGSDRKLSGDLSEIQGNLGGPGARLNFSGVKKYRRISDALADPEIEAVDICLPTDQHASVAIAALRAGKHVLVEKPMALDGPSADEMLREAARRGRVLMTGQVLRFISGYRSAAEMIRSQELGAVRAAIFRRRCAAPGWSAWLADPARSGGGVFDLLIHDVDYCVHLFGAPESVSATGYEDLAHGIDWILARFQHASLTVAITGGWHHAGAFPFSMDFNIVADGGTLEYSSADSALTLFRADAQKQTLDHGSPDFFEAELAYFLDCASHGRRPDMCPPEESAAAVKAARTMLQSRERNGERIACS